ncbi:MAG: hypothetical protein IBJ13_08995 [Sphingopyxis sp.]|nr:hypothetical protein [Sphingopyxis sp.]
MQIRIVDWPAGLNREIALVDDRAVEGLGLTFERDFDDLDRFTAAILSDGIKAFALQRHENRPGAGFVLIAAEPIDDDANEIGAFLKLTGLSAESIIWRRD